MCHFGFSQMQCCNRYDGNIIYFAAVIPEFCFNKHGCHIVIIYFYNCIEVEKDEKLKQSTNY